MPGSVGLPLVTVMAEIMCGFLRAGIRAHLPRASLHWIPQPPEAAGTTPTPGESAA